MELARPVVVLHSKGREVISPGTILERDEIRRLERWGIKHVYVHADSHSSTKGAAIFNESIRMLAKQTYEDAVVSLAKLAQNMLMGKDCDIEQVVRTITSIIEVITLEESILQFLSRIKMQDEYIYRHGVDVCVTSLMISRFMGYTESDLYKLGVACLLHDIGLLDTDREKWDASILFSEAEGIKEHPLLGANLAKKIPGISEDTLKIIAQHHEFRDGTGYPAEIKNLEIHPLARVAAICDAYMTLVSPYDTDYAISPHEAMIAVVDPAFQRFDPRVMRAFVNVMTIYPSGTLVRLSNDSAAIVVSGNKDHPLRPCLLVIFENGDKPVKPFRLDLCSLKHQELFIESVLSPDTFGDAVDRILTAV